MVKEAYATIVVILRSLLVARSDAPLAGSIVIEGKVYLVVLPKEVSFDPAELRRAVGEDGKLALFFPQCKAPAAPFVLFRLKRQGYSDCRAIATSQGLLVDAKR